MEQVNDVSRSPAYVGKMVIFFTPTGEIKLVVGNQQLKVEPEELRAMFDLWVQIAAAFEVNGNGNNAE